MEVLKMDYLNTEKEWTKVVNNGADKISYSVENYRTTYADGTVKNERHLITTVIYLTDERQEEMYKRMTLKQKLLSTLTAPFTGTKIVSEETGESHSVGIAEVPNTAYDLYDLQGDIHYELIEGKHENGEYKLDIRYYDDFGNEKIVSRI